MRWLKAWHVWFILVSATLISWTVTENTSAARLGSTAVILIAAFKINMVIAHFMELKWQPRPFRFVLSCWIALVSLIIVGGIWAA
jgi:Prokaryotic Cytochrome C oxidase subunit IV